MVDNVTADAGSGGAVFATDDIGGVHYPITKITFGALDSQTIASSGNGTTDAGTQRVTISSDSTGVISVDDNGGALTVDGTVTANLSATDNAVLDNIATQVTTVAGAVSTQMQVDIVADGAGLLTTTAHDAAFGTAGSADAQVRSIQGVASMTPVQVTLDSETTKVIGTVINGAAGTGGMSYTLLPMAAADNDTVIKASAGTVYFISVQSLDATPVYLKLFDAASITPGTTDCDMQFMCPANSTAANGAGIVLNFSPGIQFGTGIVALVATGIATDDNTAVSANEVVVNIGWE